MGWVTPPPCYHYMPEKKAPKKTKSQKRREGIQNPKRKSLKDQNNDLQAALAQARGALIKASKTEEELRGKIKRVQRVADSRARRLESAYKAEEDYIEEILDLEEWIYLVRKKLEQNEKLKAKGVQS